MKSLLEDGAGVNKAMAGQRAPLYLAADRGHCEIIQLLINAGAHVNARDEELITPLLAAAGKGFP